MTVSRRGSSVEEGQGRERRETPGRKEAEGTHAGHSPCRPRSWEQELLQDGAGG